MIVELTNDLIHHVASYASYTLRKSGNNIYTQSSENHLEGLVYSKAKIESLDTKSLNKMYDYLKKINFETFKFQTYIIYDHEKYLELMQACRSILANLCIVEILKRKEAVAGVSC